MSRSAPGRPGAARPGIARGLVLCLPLLLPPSAARAQDAAPGRTAEETVDALAAAFRDGGARALAEALDALPDPDKRDARGDSPLHAAAAHPGRAAAGAVAAGLLARGADPDAVNDQGLAPLHVAASFYNPVHPGPGAGPRAADPASVLLAAGADPSARTPGGLAPLHLAALSGNDAAAESLLARGARADAPSPLGTPLRVAAAGHKAGHVHIAGMLADAGADPDETGPRGEPPLVAAARNVPAAGHDFMVRQLLRKGADPGATDARGHGLHHLAAMIDDIRLAVLARGAGLDPNAGNRPMGETPLHLAASLGRERVAEFLLDNGADPDARTAGGLSAEDMARGANNLGTLKLLLRRVAIRLFGDVRRGRGADAVRRALAAGRDPDDLRDANGNTLAHAAAAHGRADVLAPLIAAGADLDAVNGIGGQTPLHMAVVGACGPCVQALLAAGADPSAADGDGRTPLQLARARNAPQTVAAPLENARAAADANAPAPPRP